MSVIEWESPRLRDVGIERRVLSCIIKSQDTWLAESERLTADDFATPLNRSLFQVIDNVFAAGGQPDPVTVYDRLPKEQQKEIDEIGGWGYIDTLIQTPIASANAKIEIDKLKQLSFNRSLARLSQDVAELAIADLPQSKKTETLETELAALGDDKGTQPAMMGDGLLEWVSKRMENVAEIPGIKTGFPELDRSVQGLQPGRMYVVGARKKTGKSIILLNWAKSLAVDEGIPVLWISTEHTLQDEQSRLLSLVSGVWETRIGNGMFQYEKDDTEAVMEAAERIKNAPFHFYSMTQFNVNKVVRAVRKHVKLYGIKAVFFDYIKLPSPEGRDTSDWRAIGNFADGLKNQVAVQFNLPVVTACQLNRRAAELFRQEEEADSDDFAQSDIIAQAMSVGMVLRKLTNTEKGQYNFLDDDDSGRILKITDNRHGPTSYKALIRFNGNVISMRELERV